MQPEEPVVAITDPGEVGKEHHNMGDRITVAISNLFAWMFPILMVIICTQVVLRTLGRAGIGPGNQAWMDDLQWWLYGAAVLVGIGYAVTTNSHVRVDIFYDGFKDDKKRKYDIFALVWLFLPFVILCWDVTLGYAIASIASDEGSSSPNGLHNLWILKAFMNVAFLFIAYAIWSAYTRYLAQITEPTLFKKLAYAFPTTMFVVNLAIYYVLWWAIYLTSPAETTTRDIGRHALFDEFDLGPWEIKYTIVITLVVTFALLGVVKMLERSSASRGAE